MMANGRIRPLWPVLISVLLALFATGCSTSTENGGLSLVDEQGNHPANFLSTHPAFAVSSVAQCRPCHGDDLAGGIANTSCYTAACHHGTVPGWSSPAEHGASAKRAPGNSGFKSCQICHASEFTGGGANVSCFLCHATAPHPANWRSGDTYVHTSTAEANASVCAQCHLNGNNSPIGPPSPPAPAGTSPGCFNSTLCHGASAVPHPVDNTWVAASGAAQPHGNSAKTTPGASTGFAYCQVCHGTGQNFAGGSSGVDCYLCHGGLGINPHPANWRTGDTYVHTNVDQGNAAVCAYCHTRGSISPIPPPPAPPPGTQPGCFNSTLCHADVVPAGTHATGWLDPDSPAAFHGTPQITCETAGCHPISGHPTCTSCHFDNQGSRAYVPLGFTHDASVFTNHRSGALASAAGTICENCHQTSRTFRAGSSPSCQGGGQDHPNNDGCHYDATLLDPVLTNPRF